LKNLEIPETKTQQKLHLLSIANIWNITNSSHLNKFEREHYFKTKTELQLKSLLIKIIPKGKQGNKNFFILELRNLFYLIKNSLIKSSFQIY